MPGPALALLFRKLDARHDTLTPFERRLHQELYALHSDEMFPDLPAVPSARPGNRPGHASHRLRPANGRPDRAAGAAGLDENDARLQLDCERADCPNKGFG